MSNISDDQESPDSRVPSVPAVNGTSMYHILLFCLSVLDRRALQKASTGITDGQEYTHYGNYRQHSEGMGKVMFSQASVPWHLRGGGVPHPRSRRGGGCGLPHPRSRQGLSHSRSGLVGTPSHVQTGGYPIPGPVWRGVGGYPVLLMGGGYPIQDQDRSGVSHPRSGCPSPVKDWMA